MNKHELYGVKMVHPVDCMTPSFVSTLPHETGEAVYLMNSRAEAHRYAQMCGMGRKSMTATQTHFGPNMNGKAVMPAVAIVYKVDCPEDISRPQNRKYPGCTCKIWFSGRHGNSSN